MTVFVLTYWTDGTQDGMDLFHTKAGAERVAAKQLLEAYTDDELSVTRLANGSGVAPEDVREQLDMAQQNLQRENFHDIVEWWTRFYLNGEWEDDEPAFDFDIQDRDILP